MPTLKLAKLPARAPVRIIISVTPELYRTLERYAECYREAYGETEKVADLIPFMLEAFLASDKEFAKARRDMELKTAGETG
jgi:hypothetical protein